MSESKPQVTYSQNFAAYVKQTPQGKKLFMRSQRWFDFQLSKFKDGENVTLVLHNKKNKRTEQQNRYYWGAYLPLISKECNEPDLDRLHELFKGKFLTKEIVEVMGEKVRIKKSTTQLGIADFSKFIEDIHHFTDIEPPPTENYGLDGLY